MMKIGRVVLMAAVLGALSTVVGAQIVGSTLRYQAFKDWTNTSVKSVDDLQGRLVLFEFFAFW